MRHHTRASTGDTVQRLVGDVSRLQEVAVTAGLPLLGNMATLVAMTGILLWLDPLLSLVVFLAGGVFVLLSRASSGPITAAAGNSRKGEGPPRHDGGADARAPSAKSRPTASRTPSVPASARATRPPWERALRRCGSPPGSSGAPTC